MVLVQMAGRPGVGKSTVAEGLARRLGAVVFDNDVVKSALLEAGIAWEQAGPAAWECVFALADHGLAQGNDVILDNPSHYPSIPERGGAIARTHGATYAMVECVCGDDAEVQRRLVERDRLRSHMVGLGAWAPEAPGPSVAARTGRPDFVVHGPSENRFVVDTSASVEAAVESALEALLPLLGERRN